MHRRLVIIIASAAVLVLGAGWAALVAQASKRPRDGSGHDRTGARQFVGYWMGIDPLDGGDARRGITRNDDGTFAVIGRDTVFTLCDGTDRAIITVDQAAVADGALASDGLLIRCTNNQSTVTLKVRYDVIDRNIVRETTTTQADAPVDKIIFHRISAR
jgi:hypothetical protein